MLVKLILIATVSLLYAPKAKNKETKSKTTIRDTKNYMPDISVQAQKYIVEALEPDDKNSKWCSEMNCLLNKLRQQGDKRYQHAVRLAVLAHHFMHFFYAEEEKQKFCYEVELYALPLDTLDIFSCIVHVLLGVPHALCFIEQPLSNLKRMVGDKLSVAMRKQTVEEQEWRGLETALLNLLAAIWTDVDPSNPYVMHPTAFSRAELVFNLLRDVSSLHWTGQALTSNTLKEWYILILRDVPNEPMFGPSAWENAPLLDEKSRCVIASRGPYVLNSPSLSVRAMLRFAEYTTLKGTQGESGRKRKLTEIITELSKSGKIRSVEFARVLVASYHIFHLEKSMGADISVLGFLFNYKEVFQKKWAGLVEGAFFLKEPQLPSREEAVEYLKQTLAELREASKQSSSQKLNEVANLILEGCFPLLMAIALDSNPESFFSITTEERNALDNVINLARFAWNVRAGSAKVTDKDISFWLAAVDKMLGENFGQESWIRYFVGEEPPEDDSGPVTTLQDLRSASDVLIYLKEHPSQLAAIFTDDAFDEGELDRLEWFLSGSEAEDDYNGKGQEKFKEILGESEAGGSKHTATQIFWTSRLIEMGREFVNLRLQFSSAQLVKDTLHSICRDVLNESDSPELEGFKASVFELATRMIQGSKTLIQRIEQMDNVKALREKGLKSKVDFAKTTLIDNAKRFVLKILLENENFDFSNLFALLDAALEIPYSDSGLLPDHLAALDTSRAHEAALTSQLSDYLSEVKADGVAYISMRIQKKISGFANEETVPGLAACIEGIQNGKFGWVLDEMNSDLNGDLLKALEEVRENPTPEAATRILSLLKVQQPY